MMRPHESLGLPQPVGRRLPQGMSGWNLILAVLSCACVCLYIVEVNGAASKSYQLRDAQRRVDTLNTEATILQNSYVAQTSLHAISTKAQALGFVPVDSIQYMNPNSQAYALAR